MARAAIHTNQPEPALGGLRVLPALIALLLIAACAAPGPKTEPAPTPAKTEPVPLVDRTAETEYRLEAVARQIRTANEFDADGATPAAAALLAAAGEALPPDHTRERRYLDALQAAVWGRAGEHRDAAKAASFLKTALEGAGADARLLGDVRLAEVAVMLGGLDYPSAITAGDAAIAAFEAASAWSRQADACRELSAGLFDVGLTADALRVARRGVETAERLDDHTRTLRAWLDIGQYLPPAEVVAVDEAFLKAYAAAYRAGKPAWRSVVIATASGVLYGAGHFGHVVRWGDRLRADDMGQWPDLKQSGLRSRDFAVLTCQYALALKREKSAPSRLKPALVEAKSALAGFGRSDEEVDSLAQEVGTALLQIESGK